MFSGLPVVAARAGGIPELIEDGVNGFLFVDEAEAVRAIKQLLPSQANREAIGKAARAYACNHGWRSATLQLLEHYRHASEQQFIDRNPAPGAKDRTLRSMN